MYNDIKLINKKTNIKGVVALSEKKYNKIIDYYENKNRLGLDTNEIVAMYKSGMSCNKIAKELMCSFGAVEKRLKEAGVYRSRPKLDEFGLELE